MSSRPQTVVPERWDALRRYTDARIALGRAGHSLPTAAQLAFQLAHAQARDAVHLALDSLGLVASFHAMGLETLLLHSAAPDRATYLQRPDLGRRLDERSQAVLMNWRAGQDVPGEAAVRHDLAVVVADGLSALAVHTNAVALVAAVLERLCADPAGWRVAPLAVVEQGRVAIGDEVGAGLRADIVVVLIGERPGLSSPDSLGLYLTWAPRPGLGDASRNCISNVRPAGLTVELAAQRLHRLLGEARRRRLTGVALKDEIDEQRLPGADGEAGSFLLPPAP